MLHEVPRSAQRRWAIVVAAVALLLFPSSFASLGAQQDEMRALWVLRISSSQIVAAVQGARRLGVILFSYDSLSDPARGPDCLAAIVRAAFNTQ